MSLVIILFGEQCQCPKNMLDVGRLPANELLKSVDLSPSECSINVAFSYVFNTFFFGKSTGFV
jgi:hypothetical protein